MNKAFFLFPLFIAVVVGIYVHSGWAGFVAFYVVLVVELIAGALKNRSRRRGRPDASLRAIDEMNGVEFEDYVAARLRRAGWQVEFTPAVGDYGVDLIAEKEGQRAAVQCKRHGKAIGVAAVQQVVSGARHHSCTRSIVVSNQDFTSAAKQLANTHGCQLIGRRALQSWVPPPTRRKV